MRLLAIYIYIYHSYQLHTAYCSPEIPGERERCSPPESPALTILQQKQPPSSPTSPSTVLPL